MSLRTPFQLQKPITSALRLMKQCYKLKDYDHIIDPFCGTCQFEIALLNRNKNLKYILSNTSKANITFWEQVQVANSELVELLNDSVDNVDSDEIEAYKSEIAAFNNNESNTSELIIAAYYYIINEYNAKEGFKGKGIKYIQNLNNRLDELDFFKEDYNSMIQQTRSNQSNFIFCNIPEDLPDQQLRKLYRLIKYAKCDWILIVPNDEEMFTTYSKNVIFPVKDKLIILSKRSNDASIPPKIMQANLIERAVYNFDNLSSYDEFIAWCCWVRMFIAVGTYAKMKH